jgi:hypothetical protein
MTIDVRHVPQVTMCQLETQRSVAFRMQVVDPPLNILHIEGVSAWVVEGFGGLVLLQGHAEVILFRVDVP